MVYPYIFQRLERIICPMGVPQDLYVAVPKNPRSKAGFQSIMPGGCKNKTPSKSGIKKGERRVDGKKNKPRRENRAVARNRQ
jgi:hypothetical protein